MELTNELSGEVLPGYEHLRDFFMKNSKVGKGIIRNQGHQGGLPSLDYFADIIRSGFRETDVERIVEFYKGIFAATKRTSCQGITESTPLKISFGGFRDCYKSVNVELGMDFLYDPTVITQKICLSCRANPKTDCEIEPLSGLLDLIGKVKIESEKTEGGENCIYSVSIPVPTKPGRSSWDPKTTSWIDRLRNPDLFLFGELIEAVKSSADTLKSLDR